MSKLKILIAILVVAIAVGVGLITYQLTQSTANVKLSFSPSTAVATLNTGQKFSDGSVYLEPGTYVATVTAPGFDSAKKSFTITGGKNLQVIAVLEPNSSEAKDLFTKNDGEQRYREELSGILFSKTSQLITDTYPILTLLPHSGDGYSINYGASKQHPSDPRRQALYIMTDNDSYKARAINWIRYQGFNPDAYEIIYQSKDAQD